MVSILLTFFCPSEGEILHVSDCLKSNNGHSSLEWEYRTSFLRKEVTGPLLFFHLRQKMWVYKTIQIHFSDI